MKIFTCNDHSSFYPVGAASVVVAHTEIQARELLRTALEKHGLDKNAEFTLVEIDMEKPNVRILVDGEY
jgi:hypothetical protein